MPDALNRELAGFVELYRDGRVLEIRMVKPKVNAICPRLSWALERAALYLQDSPELQVGLLTSGCDKAFSAGLDFNDATGERSAGDDRRPVEGGFGGITTLWALKKPLIAVVSAPAIGGGLELALACDIIVMAEDTIVQLPELQRGLIPDGGGLQRLPRRIPYHVATAMIWTGEPMTAAEALRWGLVYRLAPKSELQALAAAIAQRMTQDAPLAQQALKEVMRAVDSMPDREAMTVRPENRPDLEVYGRMWASDDAIEGQRAFLERRPPKWSGT